MDALAHSPFGRLPPEMRNAIYKTAFNMTIAITSCAQDWCQRPLARLFRDKNGHTTKTAMGLLGTCKVIRSEALYLAFSTVKIEVVEFSNFSWLPSLLEQLNPVAVSSVRKLSVDAGKDWFGQWAVEETLASLAPLKQA
ncbi:hypothetical protein EJ03DRAFT_353572 [Teratosphaeria nubilosa]|uniref:F-box domain-containing protein n=1 Tax=Teratosphaeria nubilosa TaxID=161662 RepID=A0A6G1L2V4_9PEZI|nr:hypothetical protein EJ03DRAFT_353572 [Teratosphaeria nubilosa]